MYQSGYNRPMKLIPRTAQKILKKLAGSYPALVVTGPRQSGKTTLTQAVFPDKPYVSLEELDTRKFAQEDPRGFLNQYADGAILDEVQRVPQIFSYLQGVVDKSNRPGQFILSGTQMLMLGVIGEYLWRTLDVARGREPYVIERIYE